MPKSQYLLRIVITFTLIVGTCFAGAQAFPDSVKDFSPGVNYGFGQAYFPANVLGPPHGTSNPETPNFSPTDLLSLGTGGSITLEFSSNRIIDNPGPDFTIFENPVQPSGHPEQTFADTAIVAVSDDGTIWHTFPFDMVSSAPKQIALKSNYIGFAGVQPSLSSPTNGISPFDPAVSGGDQYDLADIGLLHARFIRITDSGDSRFRTTYDTQGDIVYDYGNLIDPDPTEGNNGISAGFDLDAVAAVNTEPWSPNADVTDWSTYD